jgi:hypothetical protein
MDIYNIFYMEHHAATATRTGSLKRSSSFKKLLKLPIWGSGETCIVTYKGFCWQFDFAVAYKGFR